MPCALSDFARSSEPVIDPIAPPLHGPAGASEDTRILRPCLARSSGVTSGPERPPSGSLREILGAMRRVIVSALLGAVVLGSSLSPTSAPVRAAETYTREALDHYFPLGGSKTGRKVDGYVYNASNRRAAAMRLLVEGVDASGHVANQTMTWIRDVPPNNRAFFEVAVPGAPSYRVSIPSFHW